MYDVKIKVMGEFLKHHANEEQTQMLPRAKKSRFDLRALGRLLQVRTQEFVAKRA